MFDKDAIEALQLGEAISQANLSVGASIGAEGHGIVIVPDDFKVHDLENIQSQRRRARGTMTTSVVADFANYANTNRDDGAQVFVDKDRMTATAVLNLGTVDAPGHADNLAVVALERSAAFSALLAIANGQPRKQTDVAEFLEDWAPFVTCRNSDVIGTGQAAAAVRNITIEAAKKVTSSEQQLGTERSAFESVQASSGDNLPTTIEFLCEPPYFGLSTRTFTLRLSVLAADKPAIVLRVVKLEEHQEGMAVEFAQLVREALDGEMPVAIGTYKRG